MNPLSRAFALETPQIPPVFLEIVKATSSSFSSPFSLLLSVEGVSSPSPPNGKKWQKWMVITEVGGLPRGQGGYLTIRGQLSPSLPSERVIHLDLLGESPAALEGQHPAPWEQELVLHPLTAAPETAGP